MVDEVVKKLIEHATCDLCDSDATQTFTVYGETLTVVLDTCDEHAGPYLKALEVGTPDGRQRRQTPQANPHKSTIHAVIPVD